MIFSTVTNVLQLSELFIGQRFNEYRSVKNNIVDSGATCFLGGVKPFKKLTT